MNPLTQQYGEINLSILHKLQAAIEEDPLQDLTHVLESHIIYYQRSVQKILIPIELSVSQSLASTEAESSPLPAKSSYLPHAETMSSERKKNINSATFTLSPQSSEPQSAPRMPDNINILPPYQSHVQPLPNNHSWEELFAMIPHGDVVWELYSRKIVKVTDTIVVKMGRGVDDFRDEVMLMEFVRKSTSIPIPEVYGFHYNEDDECFIFMSYIEGRTLQSIWSSLGPDGRKTVEDQLGRYIGQLRSFAPPSQVCFGSLATGICRDARRNERQCSSISSERQFNEFLGKFSLRRNSDHVRMLLSSLKENHRIVLTHGDLHPRNIIIKDNTIAGIIDWELGGWYPEYWEYVKGVNSTCEGWWEHLASITGEYKFEWAIDCHLNYFIVNSPISSL